MASEIPPRVSATVVEADRISSLSDGVLCHILSFLPTEHSVRTRVLSTRWNHLFSLVPVLYFRYNSPFFSSESFESDTSSSSSSSNSDSDDSSPPRTTPTDTQSKRLRQFLNFVDWVFSNYHSGHMVEFYLTVTDLFPKTFPLLSWISESLRRKVQKLVIDVWPSKPLKFPQCIFTCDSITWLKLSGIIPRYIILDVPEDVLLPRVRRVELVYVSFVDSDSARRLFRSCPVLEWLCLEGACTGDICTLDISVHTLKDLTLSYGYKRNFNLVLDVPNLKHFYYYGLGFVQGSFAIQSLKLLSVANITFQTESSEGYKSIGHLLNVICQVQKLHFSHYTLEAFQRSGRPFPLFCYLITLEIVDIFIVDPEVLLDLLDRTPHLEVLKFYGGRNSYQIHFSGERVPTCVSLHLKEVTFDYVEMLENESKTVQYLLKNAKILKTLKISMKGSREDEVEIRKELLTFPRGSRDCRIELNLYLELDTDSD